MSSTRINRSILASISALKPKYVLLASMLAALASISHALPDDSSKPIDIEADAFDYNQNDGIGEYRGNVIATQGSLEINAEVLTVIFAESGGFDRIEATGKPVNFSMLPEVGGERMIGIGEKLVYQVDSKQLEVTTNASVTQGKDKITGNLIEYNVDTTQLRARNQGNGRVTVRITPVQK